MPALTKAGILLFWGVDTVVHIVSKRTKAQKVITTNLCLIFIGGFRTVYYPLNIKPPALSHLKAVGAAAAPKVIWILIG
jgi:hypothetical protein